jgi:internalin A
MTKEKLRVYVLARELGVDSRLLVTLCRQFGIDVKNLLSSIDPIFREVVEDYFRRARKDLVSFLQSLDYKRHSPLLLAGLGLTKLPECFGDVVRARAIQLQGNRLSTLPGSFARLGAVEEINLSGNAFTGLPKPLCRLSGLRTLDLSHNRIVRLRSSVTWLVGLRLFDLCDNCLTELPPSLGPLANLETLDLGSNRLTSLPETVGSLRSLRALGLANNRLESLPKSLLDLRQLESLALQGNPALGLPPEIIGPTPGVLTTHTPTAPVAPRAVLDYYFRARTARKPLNEAKLILVGRGGVGKTSVVNRLIHGSFQPDEAKTDGIRITAWPLRVPCGDDVRLHVWDFGGQEIMHATHQFFLTQRSLYLLVLNGRDGLEDADADYWLRMIESFGAESPVIVVLNKCGEHPFDVNRRGLQQKFPGVIKDFVKTDCRDDTGLDLLRAAVEREVDGLEHRRADFPTSWFAIKDRLSASDRNYVRYDEYRQLCAELGEPDPAAQESLAGFLHRLGVALNYRDDPRLQDTHVLNPHWVTNGIYKLLNSPLLAEQRGVVRLADAARILDGGRYPAATHRFLFDLMKKFELCFSFPEDDTRYLVPELLDKQQPDYGPEFEPAACLNFQYHYPVLPEGMLPRFIVRTHALSEGQPRWRTGVVLEFEGNRALVRGDGPGGKVFISVNGPPRGCRRLLAVVRSDFERIHRDIPKLEPQAMVPVPGHPEVVVPYRELQILEENGHRILPRVAGSRVLELNVQELLDGVDLGEMRMAVAPTAGEVGRPARLFYSYSRRAEGLRNELETHLKLLERRGLLGAWHDRRIASGEEWGGQISDNLERADIVLLLISADFMASDYCYEVEARRALERHAAGEAVVIPIILRPVHWEKAPFAHLQALPRDARPVTEWPSRDAAWHNIATGIEEAVRRLIR